MARWFGKIGYVITREPDEDNDVWKEETVESTGIPGDVSTPENETD